MNHVTIKLLPGGGGRVLIHWFEHLDDGPIETPANVTLTALGPLKLGGAKGRIACMPQQTSVGPWNVKGHLVKECHSDDVRAVTCPRCQETEGFKKTMALLAEILEPVDPNVMMQRLAALAKG